MKLYAGDLENEVWKQIEGYDSPEYQVSNMGRVMSMGRRGNNKKMILIPSPDKDGYLRVTLRQNNKQYTEKLHQLVMKAFIENPLRLPEINHKFGDKSDNRVEMLEWCDESYNKIHAYKIGLKFPKKGADNVLSRRVGKYLNGLLIKEYPALSSAEEDGFTVYGICKSIKKKQNHKGHTWKYLDEKAA